MIEATASASRDARYTEPSLADKFIGFARPEGIEGIDAFLQKRAHSFGPGTPF